MNTTGNPSTTQRKHWPGGKIEIELQDGNLQFVTGGIIKGRIIVTQTIDF